MLKKASLLLLLLLINVPYYADADQKEEYPTGDWGSNSGDPNLDTMIDLYQPYVKNLSFYRPMYFLVGSDPKESKFQISLKYQFFNPKKPLAANHPWVKGFYFGYTQTSFWDLASDSAPFEDTSYKPELYFLSPHIEVPNTSIRGLFVKPGIQHESNGQGGESSRGTNTIYLESALVIYNKPSQFGLKITPRMWAFFYNDDENNPDLADYRGYGSLGVTLGQINTLVVDSTFRWAAKGPSVQLDLTYPMDAHLFENLNLYLQVQYTNSLAESLINYTRRTQAIRFGVALVR